MTRLGTLRVTAPPPSPPQHSPPLQTTLTQPCQSPQTPSPHPTPPSSHPPTIRQPPLSKNLRWTAVALVSKLSKELERPSSAIADEVALAASHDMRTRFPDKDVAPVERNTRRRVYDALKVMVAVGCIQRHGKDLRWIGVDHLIYHKSTHPNIRVSLCESRRRIGRKKAILTEMRRTVDAFDTLYSRHLREHQYRNQHSNPLVSTRRIHFPMVLVNAQHPQVAYSPDRKRVRVTTQAPFKVYSETDVVSILADRTALKRPKIAKKRRPTRGIAPISHFQHHNKRPQVTNSPQPPHVPRQRPTNRNNSLVSSKHGDQSASQQHHPPKQNTVFKKHKSRTKNNDTITASATSTDSPTTQTTQCDRNQSKSEPRKVSQVKAEPEEEATMTDKNDTAAATGLPQQMLVYNNPTTSGPSSRHDGPDPESTGISGTGTQGERDVSTAPLICNEELGIPPLDDGDTSSPVSDDDPMMGWKTGDGGDDFEQVFKAPIFHEV